MREVGAGGCLPSDDPATGSLEAPAPWPLEAVGSATRSTVETCLKPHIEGGAEVTEYWMDKMSCWGHGVRAHLHRQSFDRAPEVNRDGMREMLRRVKSELESRRC